MENSEDSDAELICLVLFGKFDEYLKQRGLSFIDVLTASNHRQNRIFADFRDAVASTKQSPKKRGAPKVNDPESMSEFARAIDQFKSEYTGRTGKKLSDNKLLELLQQYWLREHTEHSPSATKLSQARKSTRNRISEARQSAKK
jgi:hypothetical protein